MPMLALLRSGRDPSPISLLATLLVLFGLFAMMRDRMSATSEVDQASEPCDEFYDPLCASEVDGGSARRGGDSPQAPVGRRGRYCPRRPRA